MKRKARNRLTMGEEVWLRLARDEALTKQDGRCKYCRCPLKRRHATADHVEPKKHNGSNGKHNIVAACETCNRAKGHMDVKKFRRVLTNVDWDTPAANRALKYAAFQRRFWARVDLACERIRRTAR